MSVPKCVLITGASGFIGRHVVEKFRSEGVERILAITRDEEQRLTLLQFGNVFPICGDLKQFAFIRAVTYGYKPDTIVHLAANPIVRQDDSVPPAQIIDDNVSITQNLLACAPAGCRFVNASSATVYGKNACGGPIGASETRELRPNSVYGATKAASEHLVSAYSEMGNVRGINLRLVANVGPGATHGVVKDIIAKLRSDNPNLELLGDAPGSRKPFIHVSDTAKAFWLAASEERWAKIRNVNISSESLLDVKHLAEIVMEELGILKPMKWLGESANWKGDNRLVRLDCARSRALKWNPQFPYSFLAVQQAVKDIVFEEQKELVCNAS